MTNQPNIVMVSWDSVRADHMPFHGYKRNTCPFVNKMAEDGLVFENTQVSAVGTPASFSGIFTGEHASGSMEMPDPGHWSSSLDGKTLLPAILQNEGYYTGAFHFNALMSSQFGWNQGWNVYEDGTWAKETQNKESKSAIDEVKRLTFEKLQTVGLANLTTHLKKIVNREKPVTWEDMQSEVANFVENAPEPFFLWVLLIDTHHPYYPPKRAHEWSQPGTRSTYALNYIMRRRGDWVGKRRQSIINAYDNTIRYADEFMEWLIQKLAAENKEDAAMVFHSDHGDEMGEHANYGHRPLMYDTVTRVPLVMRNVNETGRIEGPHTLLDLGSTILDIAGSDERLNGRPSLLGGERKDRGAVTVQNLLNGKLGRTAAAVGEEWKVLYHPKGEWGHGTNFQDDSWEAYKVSNDPMEEHNRWGDHPAHLEDRLRKQLNSNTDSVEAKSGVNQETEKRLRELGYIE